jgi:hypothetical protein
VIRCVGGIRRSIQRLKRPPGAPTPTLADDIDVG